ncbi:hypothetical protein AKJ64_04555 [candidate division MSBL1 archaeon SCGC-AAA259E17]|uniref:Uncharacterized protein n=1 Tax=candidate division MSBL1 archaeon SCGC-AAA259E17 TaxID=1698263 RepID=A0A133UC30_9EURY|nr:hypothetical protein AKJ64_04555 [candidate division MSBL1 archaeon SCGC-AAA259E17]
MKFSPLSLHIARVLRKMSCFLAPFQDRWQTKRFCQHLFDSYTHSLRQLLEQKNETHNWKILRLTKQTIEKTSNISSHVFPGSAILKSKRILWVTERLQLKGGDEN